ncbi:MAG: uroporphyrinogen decarboxylase [Alphaproteobacteria bacterium]|nr:uroporphyrinogen decarboxylase [Alphaproteobacteria bacterium]
MRLHKTLSGQKDEKTPIWFMRQAGRYLPEYRELRASTPDFISYCLDSPKAAEATLQPIARYDLDAAIIFSDILMIPWAMGAGVHFVTGEGPKLTALETPQAIDALSSDDLEDKLSPVAKALRLTRASLAPEKSLIGFCGAPWTVATYMLEGGSSRDFGSSRRWLWRDPEAMDHLLDRLVDDSIRLLTMKAKSGADVLMVFDSWASAVPAHFQDRMVTRPMRKISDGLKKAGVNAPLIGFPKGIGENIINYAADAGVNGVGLDHGVDMAWVDANLPKTMAVQGNLDPISVIAGGKEMLAAADRILAACSTRPHIFNLGHGFNPDTPPEHVGQLVDYLRKVA